MGLALSDEGRSLASPLRTLPATPKAELFRQLADIVSTQDVDAIVIGLPLRLDGREGPEARRARAFGATVAEATKILPVFWDERLSSTQAERSLRAAGKKKKAMRGLVDQVAAALVLQSYLDAQRASE